VHGRNENPNTTTKDAIDKLRNFSISIGAMFGFSIIQWKKLAKGILNK
jgi:hypothetical protein